MKITELTAWRMDVPVMFGAFHFGMAAAVIAAAVLLALKLSCNKTAVYSDPKSRSDAADACSDSVLSTDIADARFDRILALTGWILIVLELYKQMFIFHIVNNDAYDWWYFPFQLCSVPMYLCVLLPFTGGRVRDSFLTFMASFTFVSASAALAFPEDFLRSYAVLTVHGFVWHGILLFISLLILFSHGADLSRRGFARASGLFLLLSAIAVSINILTEDRMAAAHSSGLIANSYAAMFYMNPYHISPQPVIGPVQEMAGIPLGLALYALSIIAAGGLICIFFRRMGMNRHI